MNQLERTIRTGAGTGLHADSLLAAVLMAEIISPGDDLWVISGWISDVEVIDNSQCAFDAILSDLPSMNCRLSQALTLVAAAGARINVVTRPGPHNEAFVRRLRSMIPDEQRLHVVLDPEVHEKTICGRDWMLTGSMNFTANGLGNSKEQVTYTVDSRGVAQAHLDFAQQWKV
ncbi:phospholipase D family protein [Nocardiopsis dassonvillei]|uniref:phospholipase D-like domain-containing protein DpdK n=1 Tax=Nocardiopsis dassonvillei TaxID=2014 RepID=UPI00200E93D5|nr:phospholipase D-like domain-containing protein DpdK [Nocardiopsis dassonvillei]MCK9871173.1 phospholipase D family protein [Nocardiopsis dassonvillei]